MTFQLKTKEETSEKVVEMSKNKDYKTTNLLEYNYFSKHYKLIAIDLSKQIELEKSDFRQQFILLEALKKIM